MKRRIITIIIVIVCNLCFTRCTNKSDLSNSDVSYSTKTEPVWYLKTEDDGVRLFVKEIGVGDTIVVVHGGFGAEHSYLIDAFESFFDQYHFVFYDQRGSLRSPAPGSLISIDKHISDIEELRQELNLKKLNLIGHSMGTFLCGYYASKYPENVNSMILLALVYPKTLETASDKKIYKQQQEEVGNFFERAEIDSVIAEEGLDKKNLNDKEATNKWRIGFAATNIFHLKRWRQVKGGQVFYSQEAGNAAGKTLPGNGWDFTTIYKELKKPITVINGEYDFADIHGRLYKKWLKDIDNLSYHLVDSAGHNVWIDKPNEFYQLVKRALKNTKNNF